MTAGVGEVELVALVDVDVAVRPDVAGPTGAAVRVLQACACSSVPTVYPVSWV